MGEGPRVVSRKSLGQHFLADRSVARRIVDAIRPEDHDTTVEIGPGEGALTDDLRPRARRLVCIEKDDRLIPQWRERFGDDPRLSVLGADALEVAERDLPFPGPYGVIGNLPYYVAGRITMHVVEEWPSAKTLVFMYQKEVAERIAATPGGGEYGALSVVLQTRFEATLLFPVGPASFRPAPKVQSAVVLLQRRETALDEGLPRVEFSRIVHGAFSMRRKTINNGLKQGARLPEAKVADALASCGIEPRTRPEEVSPSDWVALVRVLLG